MHHGRQRQHVELQERQRGLQGDQLDQLQRLVFRTQCADPLDSQQSLVTMRLRLHLEDRDAGGERLNARLAQRRVASAELDQPLDQRHRWWLLRRGHTDAMLLSGQRQT